MNRAGFVCVLVFAVVLPSTVTGQDPAIFREISIAPFGVIRLGEPFSQRDSLGQQLATNVFLLPAGFGGTAGIAVVLYPEDRVAGLVFEYTDADRVDEMVADYRELLGEPIVEQIADETVCVLWQDQETRFEIYEGSIEGARVLTSMMVDLAAMELGERCALERFIELGIGRRSAGE